MFKLEFHKQDEKEYTMIEARSYDIVLFLGAGASASFGYPTTQKFVEELKSVLAGSSEGILLDSLLEVPHIKDIEHVLQMLEALRGFKKYPLKEFVTKFTVNIGLPNLSTNLHDQMKIAEKLEDKILDDIYRQYEFNPGTIDSITGVYEPLMGMLSSLRGDNEIPIFTTNYDRIIEEFCSRTLGSAYVDGFEWKERTKESVWNPKEFEKKPEKGDLVKLFKLHGSLDWRRRRDGVIVKVGSEERTKGTKRFKENVLVYPAGKIQPEIDPFKTLHELFVKYTSDSDTFIFIGYSFRDDYLNGIINQHLEKKKVIIVSPNATQNVRQNLLGGRELPSVHRMFPIDNSFEKPNTLNNIEEAILKKGAHLKSR